MTLLRAVAVLCALLVANAAYAQYLPSTPLTFASGKVVLSGDVQASIAPRDDEAWFNYTDYEHNALRMFRWSIAGEWRIASRLALLAEVRGEDAEAPRASAVYLRARPFASVPLDIQAGRIPPTFGAFGRRVYSTDNLLIGYPLAYQYLLSIRTDAIPANARELLAMRARGWLSSFSVGSSVPSTGVSPINGFRWDTGVAARFGTDRAQAAVAVTNGVLCDPRVGDNNDGKQISARFQAQPVMGLILGVSGARGAWLDRNLEARVAPGQDDAQQALGFDAEYSRGYWLIRSEFVRSTWDMPGVASAADAMDLVATTGWLEGRYRVGPRWYLAGRAERLTFSRIRAAAGGVEIPWDAPVSRIELGGGVYIQRNLVARVSVQSNQRDAGRVRHLTVLATQVLFWF